MFLNTDVEREISHCVAMLTLLGIHNHSKHGLKQHKVAAETYYSTCLKLTCIGCCHMVSMSYLHL